MHPRSILALLHDLSVVAVAWLAAYWLRFNLDVPADYLAQAVTMLPWVLPINLATFWFAGLYRGIWRYASLHDLKRILLAVAAAALLVVAGMYATQTTSVPRSVLILYPMLLVGLMGGSRLLYRAWKEHHLYGGMHPGQKPVLVIGAGDAAADLLRELARSADWRVVGLLDDNTAKHGRQINGVRVLGPIDRVGSVATDLAVSHAIVAMPGTSVAARRRAMELAVAGGLSVLTVPAFSDLLSGKFAVSQVRAVELEDLLGRDRIELDEAGLHGLLENKIVLVTGAGGSIGSELCRQIARFHPRGMVFLEQSEYALYSIEQEFAGRSVTCVIGDVKDAVRMDAVFAEHRPEVVFHAAAYKHVPLMECANAWEAVRNNVQGTLNVARAALAAGASEFVLISTDKAVNPTNVMGASKRLAEVVCQAVQAQGSTTRFVMVRFGNVLGSSGSVIPRFREQIAKGGPVTVTHPEIIRYFMLIPEAAQLVLQAGLIAAREADGGRVFVLDMGEPVKIVDLARDMIRLSGFTEDEIRIEFTGLRPGEKLYEELLADGEATLPTPHPKLRIAKPSTNPDDQWLADLEQWLAAPWHPEAEVKTGLRHWVPEYRPAGGGTL
jgi:FlaA1/EpsC-like NDP-sugar epimerase